MSTITKFGSRVLRFIAGYKNTTRVFAAASTERSGGVVQGSATIAYNLLPDTVQR